MLVWNENQAKGEGSFTESGNKYQPKLYHSYLSFFKKELQILSILDEFAGQKGEGKNNEICGQLVPPEITRPPCAKKTCNTGKIPL